MFAAVRAFEMKLKKRWKMQTCVISLPVICFIRMDQLRVTFPSVRAVEMIASVAEKFRMRFIDFRRHATNTYISLKTNSPFKSVMLQKNCSLTWLNCSMTQFWVVGNFDYLLFLFTSISVLWVT
jgi:hypothetical protein